MIQNNISAIVIALAAVLGVALALIVYLFWRVRRTEAECDLLTRGTQGKNFVEIVNDNIDQVEALLKEVDGLSEQYGAVLRRMAGAVQHVGVVRFDAFRDMGGLMSFAVALLDDRGNGIVMSSIYGRSESRTYTKPVVERGSTYELSPEEKEAIRLAMQSKEMGALPVIARDREHEEKLATLKLFHDKELAATMDQMEPPQQQRQPERGQRTRQEQDSPVPRETFRSRSEAAEERFRSRPMQRRGSETASRSAERSGESAADRLRGRRPAPRTAEGAGPESDTAKRERTQDRGGVDTGGRAPVDEEPPRILGGEELIGDDPRSLEPSEPPAPSTGRKNSGRPRGLDTPVERLRDRERGRE
jgi:hypothetical protein